MFNFDGIFKALQSDPNTQKQVMSGAAGLAAGMLLSGGHFGKLLGNGAKLGAAAAIGGLAWSAYQKYQAQNGAAAPTREDQFMPPDHQPQAQEELGRTLVRAMIAAAKADGQIDAEERDRIFKKLETMPLGPEEKAFVFDELSSPLDLDAVVARADTTAHGAEIYAASLVAMRPDTDTERAYLAELARRLRLDPGLISAIHAEAGATPPSP